MMSTGDESSSFARYAFRRHFYQHAGFRVVRSLDVNAVLPLTLVCDMNGLNHGRFVVSHFLNNESTSDVITSEGVWYHSHLKPK